MKKENKEIIWNFVLTFNFLIVLVITGYLFGLKGIEVKNISVIEIVLIILATFRMIRLLVYDAITKFIRDYFRRKAHISFFSIALSIYTCPWCTGVWLSLFIVDIMYFIPHGDVFVLVLAIAGVSTLIQLLSNIIGLTIKEKKQDQDK